MPTTATAASIPKWTADGVLPPIDLLDPTSSNRSPYRVVLSDLVLHFGTSPERVAILDGLLRYRAQLHATGLTVGFQWIDGSFLENIEIIESRAPNDVDIVTFYKLAPGDSQAAVLRRNPDLFDRAKLKTDYLVDAYDVDLNGDSERLVGKAAYWYSVWSHRRSLAWRGFVEIELASVGDAAAVATLSTLQLGGTRP
jgi:hypothetical protein